jgi:hypothetical protein
VPVGSGNFCVVYNVLGTLGPLRDAQYAVSNTYPTGMLTYPAGMLTYPAGMLTYPAGMLTYLFKEE